MDASFSSDRTALAFVGAMAGLMALPWVVSQVRGDRRDGLYQQTLSQGGPYEFIENEVLRATGPIDIVAIGPSYLWSGFDAPLVKRALGQVITQREPVVLNLSSNWRGEELYYLLARDLLARRKVSLVVLTMNLPVPSLDEPHPMARYWMTVRDAPLLDEQLTPGYRAKLSAQMLTGAPRQLLSLVRDNWVGVNRYAATLGSGLFPIGYRGAPFIQFHPPPPVLTAADLIDGQGAYRFTGNRMLPHEELYVARLARLLEDKQVAVAILHVPGYTGQETPMRSPVLEERRDWRQTFGSRSALVGIPPAVLFRGLSDEQIRRLYYNYHLNSNGAEFFTRAIAPALVDLHEKQRQP
jgi:hypothetical protein